MLVALALINVLFLLNSKINVQAEDNAPEVNFLGVEHSPLIEGDTETFYITSTGTEKVHYKAVLQFEDGTEKILTPENSLYDFHQGKNVKVNFTKAMDPNQIYKVTCDSKFPVGHHKLVIYIRKAGWSLNGFNDYDSTYTSYINCVSRDDSNVVYANASLKTDKDIYTVGEKVKINGLDNVGDISLHAYNTTTDTWYKDVSESSDTVSWIPTESGMYILDAHIDSTEAWKLKIITVNPVSSNTNAFDKVNVREISNYGSGYIVNGKEILLNNIDGIEAISAPYYNMENNFNPEVKSLVYNVANVMIKDNKYTSLLYRNDAGLDANAVQLFQREDNGISKDGTFGYYFFTADRIANSAYFSKTSMMKYKDLCQMIVDEGVFQNTDDFRKCNSYIFNEHNDKITDFILSEYSKHKKEKNYKNTLEVGNYLIELDTAYGSCYLEAYIKR